MFNDSKEIVPVEIVKKKTQFLNQTFFAIDEARQLLRQLEEIAVKRVDGPVLDVSIDLVAVAAKTNRIRSCVDRILIGLTEAATIGRYK